jgi:HAD superfamily hydrolase (TIGR01549 family)
LISSNKIKAILFDLDGTLRHHIPAAGDVFVEYAKSIGCRVSEEDQIRSEHWVHHYFAYSLEIQADEKNFRDDRKGFWINFTKRRLVALGLQTAQAIQLAPQISAYMEESHKPEVHVPPDVVPLLKFLKKSGYVLGMVSNRDEPYHDEMKNLKLESYFKFILAGGEVKSFKPHNVIFEHALNLAGTSAQETMYIGDNYFADIVGSRRAGLIPVLYDPICLFPDVECLTIKSFAELHELLK